MALHHISALLGTTASLNVGPKPTLSTLAEVPEPQDVDLCSEESHDYTFRLFGSVLDLTGSLQQGIWEGKFPGGGLKGDLMKTTQALVLAKTKERDYLRLGYLNVNNLKF